MTGGEEMSFNEFKKSIVVKAIALVLCIAGLGTALFGGLVVLYGYESGYVINGVDENGYAGDDLEFCDTKGYEFVTLRMLWRVEEHFFETLYVEENDECVTKYVPNNEVRRTFNKDNFGLGFEIYEIVGNNDNASVEADTQQAAEQNEEPVAESVTEEIAASNERTVETDSVTETENSGMKLLYKSYEPDVVAGEGEMRIDENYLIKYKVDGEFAARDSLYWEKLQFEFVSKYWSASAKAGLAGGIVFLLTIIYLCVAAGHRKNREEIMPNLLDRIPYDIHFVLSAGIALFSGIVLAVIYDSSAEAYGIKQMLFSVGRPAAYLAPAIVIFAVMSAMVVAFILTTATRFKIGGWWKNTVIYHLIRLAVRFAKFLARQAGRAVSAFPLIWKTALASFIMMILILGMAVSGNPLGILISLLLAAIFIGAIIYCSISMRKLQKAAEELASGNDEYRVNTDKLILDFKGHGENLNSIGEGINLAVQQRMKSERLKTELITNVSHDIKTPLTSIINYVDLLEKENLEGSAGEYVQVIKRQSARLKKLTQDVVDASKASTGNMEVHLAETDILEIVNQAAAEYRERLEEKRLDLVIKNESGAESLIAKADGRLLWRAMDNLMSNICKYSLEGSRVYVNTGYRNGRPSISFKNISKNELDISAEELMERFVRGDSSRNTEGSGLGLNIARSLMEIQGGTLSISIDGDLFRADVELNRP